MATKAKESSQVKAKRGTSPSLPRNVDTTQRKKSLNPGTASPDQQKHGKTSSSSETTKPVPSYLRATKSSSLDPFKQQANKKPTSTAGTAQKPAALSRRRSFDKPPPSTSQVQKPGGTTTTRERVLRSSSFTSTNHLSKPKTHFNDVGRPQSEILRRGNTKKTSTTTIQKQQRDVGTTSKLKSKTAHSPCTTAMNEAENASPRFEVEPHQDDQESSVTDVGEDNSIVVNDESNNELPGNDILVLDDKDHVHMLDDEVLESDESSEIKVCEASTLISKEDKTKSPTVGGEEAEDEIPIEEIVNNIEEVEEEQNNIEQNENHKHPEEIFVSGSKGESTEISEQVEETETETETETDGNGEENALDEKEEADEGKVVESTKIPEQIVEVTADNHVKSEKNNSISAAKPQGGGQGNKKDLAAYNDVIEETATKLRQQRKNKVLALVGAFETVISLQDPES